VWGSTKETVSTTAYPSTTDWEVIRKIPKDEEAYLYVIEIISKKFRHIAVSREQRELLSLKEVQIFSNSKKSEFQCLFTIKTLYKMTV